MQTYLYRYFKLSHVYFLGTYSAVEMPDYPDTIVTVHGNQTHCDITTTDHQYTTEETDKSSGISSYATQNNTDQNLQNEYLQKVSNSV